MDNSFSNSSIENHQSEEPHFESHTCSEFNAFVTPPPIGTISRTQSRFFNHHEIRPPINEPIKQERNLPPPPPKTPFMCFSESKEHDENSNSLKDLAAEWRLLSSSEKQYWDEEARKEKTRYIKAKARFIPTPDSLPKRRAKKHPLAPKRPMSAFLKFSLNTRKSVKASHPDMNNTDISRLLGEMWRNAQEDEKKPYVEAELKERQKYKEDIQRWRLIQKKKEVDETLNTKLKAKFPPPVESPVVSQESLRVSSYLTPIDFSSRENDNKSLSPPWSQLNRTMKFEDVDNVGEFNSKIRFSPTRNESHESLHIYNNYENKHQHHYAPVDMRSQLTHHQYSTNCERGGYGPSLSPQSEHGGSQLMNYQYAQNQYPARNYENYAEEHYGQEYYSFPHKQQQVLGNPPMEPLAHYDKRQELRSEKDNRAHPGQYKDAVGYAYFK